MRSTITAALLIACLLFSQLPVDAPAQAAEPAIVTIPTGTVVPLTLVSQIKNKSSKPGDSVRAAVAFPVTVGSQLAIPAGTYVEGTLLPAAPKVKHQPDPGVQIHFTRLVFANGYSASLDATQAAGLAGPPPVFPSESSPQTGFMALSAALGSFDPASLWSSLGFRLPSLPSSWRSRLMSPQAFPPVTNPATPVAPRTGPSPGIFIGLGLGVAIVFATIGLLYGHRASKDDYIVHDAGWQFQMKLSAPLSLNTAQIASKIP